jgi:hypothetical protein
VETGDAAAIVGTARIKQPDKRRRSLHEAASTFALKNSTDQTEQILPATARMMAREVKFVTDSPLEGAGFELRVPRRATASETHLLTDGLTLLSSTPFRARLPLGDESFGGERLVRRRFRPSSPHGRVPCIWRVSAAVA